MFHPWLGGCATRAKRLIKWSVFDILRNDVREIIFVAEAGGPLAEDKHSFTLTEDNKHNEQGNKTKGGINEIFVYVPNACNTSSSLLAVAGEVAPKMSSYRAMSDRESGS